MKKFAFLIILLVGLLISACSPSATSVREADPWENPTSGSRAGLDQMVLELKLVVPHQSQSINLVGTVGLNDTKCFLRQPGQEVIIKEKFHGPYETNWVRVVLDDDEDTLCPEEGGWAIIELFEILEEEAQS